MRAGGHDAHFLLGVGEANRDRAVGAVERDDAVVVAAALAEAPAGAVERQQRHEEEARRKIGAVGGGDGTPNASAVSASSPRQARKRAGPARLSMRGSATVRPALASAASNGRPIDLAADGPVAGDGRELREFEREVLDQLERGVARFDRARARRASACARRLLRLRDRGSCASPTDVARPSGPPSRAASPHAGEENGWAAPHAP